ncbi:MAG: hypothetical protein K8L99_35110 [Anaerolineae bacterium]|nr:hypothetical protein [Anaerolineae bacterium]
MTHKSTSQQRTSDFPIFAYLEAINPARLWREFQNLPRYQRMLILSIIMSAILAASIIGLAKLGINHYLATRGAFLEDALVSPYGIEEKLLPAPVEGTPLLPLTVANYNYIAPPTDEEQAATAKAEADAFRVMLQEAAQALEIYEPAQVVTTTEIAEATEDPNIVQLHEKQMAAAAAALVHLEDYRGVLRNSMLMDTMFQQSQLGPLRQSMVRLNELEISIPEITALQERIAAYDAASMQPIALTTCLTGTEDLDTEIALTCGMTTIASQIESGSYQKEDGTTLSMTAAAFDDHDTATETLKALHNYAERQGTIGNFTLGVVDVDYFFSRIQRQNTFGWTHGDWVFVVTANNFDKINTFMQVFPY